MEDEPHGVHDFVYDPRNADVLISVNGELKHRDEATVSVFDSGYLLGDGVWEGLRVKDGGVAFLDEHLKRLYAGAKTIDMDIGLTKDELTARLFDCLKAQDMTDGVHIRLMVTRGIKKTPYQGPRFTITKPTVVIIPEYKAPVPEVIEKGLSLFTVHVRRTGPAEQDQKLRKTTQRMEALKKERAQIQQDLAHGLSADIKAAVNQDAAARGPRHGELRKWANRIVNQDPEIVGVLLEYRQALLQAMGPRTKGRLFRYPGGSHDMLLPISDHAMLTGDEYASLQIALGHDI